MRVSDVIYVVPDWLVIDYQVCGIRVGGECAGAEAGADLIPISNSLHYTSLLRAHGWVLVCIRC